MRQTRWRRIGLLVAAFWGGLACHGPWARAADAPSAARRADQEALKPYGPLVGEWRGAGQVERGKTKGAWFEQADWAWKLANDSAALEGKVGKGKYLKSITLRPGK